MRLTGPDLYSFQDPFLVPRLLTVPLQPPNLLFNGSSQPKDQPLRPQEDVILVPALFLVCPMGVPLYLHHLMFRQDVVFIVAEVGLILHFLSLMTLLNPLL